MIAILFVAASLMAFFGGPEAVGVFSLNDSSQVQNAQDTQDTASAVQNQPNGSSGTEENTNGNNPEAADSKQGTEEEQPGTVQAGDKETNPSGDYRIDVDLAKQIVTIYFQGNAVKQFTASTGVNDSTPRGDFEIQNRGEWFFSEKYQQGAKYWVSFKDWGVYLFHSVPMDKNKNIIPEEAAKLGTPASHGCVRLEVENAQWLYETIPQGTKVHIH